MLVCVAGHCALPRTGKDTRKMNPCRIFACAAALLLAVPGMRAAVSDGFPDQSAHHVATGASAAPLEAFDSFVASRAAAASAMAQFSSFVSTSVASTGALSRFNSSEPAGFVLVVR